MTRKKIVRYKLLLDEMLPKRDRFPHLNNLHNLRHITHDYKLQGSTDVSVVTLARREKRILITKNYRHFRLLSKQLRVDLISIKDGVPFELIDVRVAAYLRARKVKVMTGVERKVNNPLG